MIRRSAAYGRAVRGRSADGDAGETLIELLVAVVIMGTAVVAVVASLIAAAISTQADRRLVASNNEATRVAEIIQGWYGYNNCEPANNPYGYIYSSPFYQLPPGYAMTVTAKYLHTNQAPNSTTPFTPQWDSTCPGGLDQGLQQITVTVWYTGQGAGHRKASVTIVKRRPA